MKLTFPTWDTWDTWIENDIQRADKKIINQLLSQLNTQLEKTDLDSYQAGYRYYFNYDWRNYVGNIPPRLMWDRYLPDAWGWDPALIQLCLYISKESPLESITRLGEAMKFESRN